MPRLITLLLLALSCLTLPIQAQDKLPHEMGKLGKQLIDAINEYNAGRLQEADVLANAERYLALCNSDEFRYGTYYAEARHIKANAVAATGDYAQALQIMDEVISVRLDKRTTSNNDRLGDAYFDRATYLYHQKNTDQAISDMQAAADAYQKARKNDKYATSLCQLALYYNYRAAPGDAEQKAACYKKALPFTKRGTVAYYNATAWTINAYNEQGDYDGACKLLQKIQKEGGGEHPIRYADFLSLVSESEARVRHYSEALALADEAFAIYEGEGSTSSRNYAYLLKNAGDCYFNQSEPNFEKALLLYEQAEPLLLKVEGAGGKVYEGCKQQKNATNVWLGKVDQVQDYLQKLEDQINNTNDTTTLIYANALADQAKGKAGIGIYDEAAAWGERALRRFEARGDSLRMVHMLYTLSGYYTHLGKHQYADSLNNVSLQISQRRGFTQEAANILHQKAASLYQKEDYRQADEVCQEALDLLRKSNLSTSTAYANILCDRALFLYKLDSINAAIDLTREALDLQTRILGPKHGNNVTLLFNLAIYHFKLEQMDSVAHYYHNAISLQTDLVRNNFSSQTSRQREHFWQRKNYLYQTASLFASLPDKTPPALLTDIYNAQLFTKGILLNSEIDFRRLLQKSGDKDVLNMYDELQTKRTELQKCYETQNSNKDSRSIKQLEDRIRQLNWAIVRKCKEYGDFTQNLSLTTDSVRRSLRPDEAAVELVETDVTLNNNPDHIYIALILRPGWNAPHACHLFFRSDIEKLNYPTGVPICQLLNDSTYQNRIYNDSKLGQLVWGNLLKELDGATHIYFAPSGIFHQWGIEYMPITDDGKRISDTLSVSRLSSTKLLAQRTDRSASLNTGEAVIFGGMDYEMSIGEMRKYNKAGKEEFYEDFSALAAAEEQLAAEQQADASLAAAELPEELRGANTSAILSMTRQGELKFGKLKGANDEAETIERILRQAGVKATRYGAYGTEGAFKALNGHKISLLHIATHGFSYAVTEQDIPQIDWLKPYASSPLPTDPLCYSGLVFAGCNQKTQYHRDDFPTDINDGIVTAQEIAQLNLQDLQLTVLSACQTGLGELREDGVFGVQRGFKKAGAHTLVMSLWSVDDAATQLMMTSFYEALLSGLSRNDAFLKAQARVRDSFPDPHYWAPFIMLDDI